MYPPFRDGCNTCDDQNWQDKVIHGAHPIPSIAQVKLPPHIELLDIKQATPGAPEATVKLSLIDGGGESTVQR